MTRKLAPAGRSLTKNKPELAINCPENCSFHPIKIGNQNAAALKAARENGAGQLVFARRAAELLGHPVPHGNVQRHLKHYVEVGTPEEEYSAGPKPSDLEILDAVIYAGFKNSKNWKPTIRDTLEAMKLKTQMTGNSAFDDLLSLFDSADDPDPDSEEPEEAPEAVLSPEERPDEHDEDLGEPLGAE